MNAFFEQVSQFLRRLPFRQKVALAAVLLGVIATLAAVAYWSSRPDYTLLFGNLEPTQASQVVEKLKEQKIPYQLKENGTAIYVPRENVYDLRLSLVGDGLANNGPDGYKLLDNRTFGMTNEEFDITMKRALEGELVRTITSLNQVIGARVHLVLGKRRAFARETMPATASVVLQLKNNAALTRNQIEGITSLVAGAVEGLNPANVTVLDRQGNLLSNPNQDDPDALLSSTQMEFQRAKESYLAEKGQSMLDQVLGNGNAIVRVAATLDFARSVVESKNIDPESATVISEEKLDEKSDTDNATSSVKNYELSQTTERAEKSIGDIKYLTVSVILNQKLAPPAADDPEALPQPIPYSAEELNEIVALVKNAVGFDEKRGDRIAIPQTLFDTSIDEQFERELEQQRRQEQWELYLRYGLMALSLLLALWLMRSMSQRVVEMTRVAPPDEQPARALPEASTSTPLQAGGINASLQLSPHDPEDELILVDDIYTSKLSAEAKARLKAKHKLFDEIKEQVSLNPQDTAELIRSWIAEDQKHENVSL